MAEKRFSDFNPDFFAAWDLAKEGRLSLSFESRGQAVNFRHRLYSFRRKLSKEMMPAPCPYDSLELSILEKDGQFLLGTQASPWRQQIREDYAKWIKETKEKNGGT
jgi:hypothetical protein